jgi:hypothetical protein
VALLTTFDTPEILHFVIARLFPFFQASVVFVTDVVALRALDDIFFIAVFGLRTNFVAFEANVLLAVKRLVGVFAAKDAVHSLGLVGTFASHVTELLTVVTLHCDIFFCPVTLSLQFLHGFKSRLFTIFSLWLLWLLFF